MDKKYNENWIVVIGQGFSFEVTHEVKHVLWMYFCDIAVLVCKAGSGLDSLDIFHDDLSTTAPSF